MILHSHKRRGRQPYGRCAFFRNNPALRGAPASFLLDFDASFFLCPCSSDSVFGITPPACLSWLHNCITSLTQSNVLREILRYSRIRRTLRVRGTWVMLRYLPRIGSLGIKLHMGIKHDESRAHLNDFVMIYCTFDAVKENVPFYCQSLVQYLGTAIRIRSGLPLTNLTLYIFSPRAMKSPSSSGPGP